MLKILLLLLVVQEESLLLVQCGLFMFFCSRL